MSTFTHERMAALKAELEAFDAHMDDSEVPHDDELELDIMKLCFRIPAGYEDLL
jgi:hypothetical protein